ncbi:MAG: TolC family protein [Rhodocyclaceae bacterium]
MNRMIALAIGLSMTMPAQAQSLADAVEKAWSRHPQLVASTSREAEAQARAAVATGITPGPASMSVSNLNDRLNQNRGKQEWEVEMAVPLWVPGQQAARETEAASAQAQVLAQRHALRLQIAGEVRDAWWAVAAARSARELAARRLVTSSSLETDVLRRFKVGELSRIDANLARNERLTGEAELADAETALRQAEQAYQNLTGAAAPTVLAVEKAAATREARDDHPQLVAAAATAQLARAKFKVAEETRRDAPEFAVRVVRGRGDSAESYDNLVGVKLTIPFSSGPRVRQENAAAKAELAQADAEMALAQLRLKLDTEKARLDLDAAERQLAMARQRRELTADNLALAEKSFALGESDLTTLLRVRVTAFEGAAFLNRQEILHAASLSRLNQVMGVLP